MRHLVLSLLIALVTAYAPHSHTSARPPDELGPDVAGIVRNCNILALDLYDQLAEQDGNLFFSPYSISNALAMTYAGARGETETQMAETLHFALDQERLHPAFGTLRKQIEGGNEKRNYQLQIANRLWGQQDYGFLPEFLWTIERNYDADLKQVDFVNDTEEARTTINRWVEEQTSEKIKNLIKPGILTLETRLVIASSASRSLPMIYSAVCFLPRGIVCLPAVPSHCLHY